MILKLHLSAKALVANLTITGHSQMSAYMVPLQNFQQTLHWNLVSKSRQCTSYSGCLKLSSLVNFNPHKLQVILFPKCWAISCLFKSLLFKNCWAHLSHGNFLEIQSCSGSWYGYAWLNNEELTLIWRLWRSCEVRKEENGMQSETLLQNLHAGWLALWKNRWSS